MYELKGELLLDTSKFEGALSDAESMAKDLAGGGNALIGTLGKMAGKLFTLNKLKDVVLDIGETYMDFGKTMSNVESKIGNATTEEMKMLGDKAKEMGRLLPASAADAGEAMKNLAGAGFKVNDIMQSVEGTLFLASSAAIDMGTASSVVVGSLNGFGLSAEKANHLADVLAKTSADTGSDIVGIGESMKYVAPVAHAYGQSLETTAGAIGILADYEIKGSQAGTTMRSMLQSLTGKTDKAREAMDSLGFSAYDVNGNMKPLPQMINELNQGLDGMTQEEKTNVLNQIFGQESISGVLALLDAGGDKLGNFSDELTKCDGAAKKMAETQTNNLYGALESVKGQFETIKINIGEAFGPTVTTILNNFADVLPMAFGWLDKLPAKIEEISNIFGPMFSRIGESVAPIVETIFKPLIYDIIPALGQVFMSTLPIVAEVVAGAFEIIAAVWNNTLKPIFDMMYPIISSTITSIVEVIKPLMTTLKGIVEFVAGIFTANWEKSWQGVKDIFGGFVEGITRMVEGVKRVIGGIGDAIQTAKEKAKGGIAKVKGFLFGGADANANGTSYFNGGMTAINERGGEMQVLKNGTSVIPADRTKEMLENKNLSNNGGGGNVFNIQVHGVDAFTFVDEVIGRLQNQY